MSGILGDEPSIKDEQVIQRQTELERRAAASVKPWSDLKKDDYDFRSWARGATKERLQVGCLYEYSRESWKVRGLAVLMNRELERKSGTNFGTGEPCPLPCSFEGLRESDVCRTLGAWLDWLAGLADPLANNVSFAELNRTKPNEIARAFRCLSPRNFFQANAVELAWTRTLFPVPVTALEALEDERVCSDGSEVLALRIRWEDFTNKEIGLAMEMLAHGLRPESCKEPKRKGPPEYITVRAALDALSAMRLASRRQKHWAIEIFSEIQLGHVARAPRRHPALGEPDIAESNFDRLAAKARRLFAEIFPLGNAAENASTWAQRRRVTK